MPEEAVEELAGAIQDANGGPIQIVSNGSADKQPRGSGAGTLGFAWRLLALAVSSVRVWKAVHCLNPPD